MANAAVIYAPTRGFKEDLNKLLETFAEANSLGFEQFANIWRSMQFSYICAGRKTERECIEFLEDINAIVTSFCLPPYSFQVRVGALYTLYSLYSSQPCEPRVQIRVTPIIWRHLQEMQQEAHKEKNNDVVYIFLKLFHHHAFLFVAKLSEVSLTGRERRGGNLTGEPLKDELRNVATFVPNIFTPAIIQQVQAIHQQYRILKLAVAGPGAERPHRSLDVVEDDIIANIESYVDSYKQKSDKIIQGRNQAAVDSDVEEAGINSDEEKEYIPSGKYSRASVKARAYTSQATPTRARRYRQVVTEESSTSSPDKAKKRKVSKKQSQDVSMEESDDVNDDNAGNTDILSMPNFPTDDAHVAELSNSHHKQSMKSGIIVKKEKVAKKKFTVLNTAGNATDSPVIDTISATKKRGRGRPKKSAMSAQKKIKTSPKGKRKGKTTSTKKTKRVSSAEDRSVPENKLDEATLSVKKEKTAKRSKKKSTK